MSAETGNTNIIHTVEEMRAFALKAKARGKKIGLVPTMGALHEGHLSLIRLAALENDIVIVSIFVNPIQFDDPNDFSSYPKTLKADAEASTGAGAGVLFVPSADEIYPDGHSTFIDMTGLSEQLCGASRPSHFRGVLTVVGKLFGICLPDFAYFGEKDAQQLAVVRKMTAELNMNVEIRGCPTIREEDGLAMSSRNGRLSADERTAARCLNLSLKETSALFNAGETSSDILKAALRSAIDKEPLACIEYADIVDPLTFEPVSAARKGDLLAVAAYIGDVRLIDNQSL